MGKPITAFEVYKIFAHLYGKRNRSCKLPRNTAFEDTYHFNFCNSTANWANEAKIDRPLLIDVIRFLIDEAYARGLLHRNIGILANKRMSEIAYDRAIELNETKKGKLRKLANECIMLKKLTLEDLLKTETIGTFTKMTTLYISGELSDETLASSRKCAKAYSIITKKPREKPVMPTPSTIVVLREKIGNSKVKKLYSELLKEDSVWSQ